MASPLEACAAAHSVTAAGYCRASVLGFLVASPLLILIGTAGNLWTAVIVTRLSLSKSRASALILAHVVMDTLALWTGLSRHFYMNLSGVDVRETSAISCKVQRFVLYTAMDASATILVAISVDRFLAVWMPHRKNIFTIARARIVVFALTVSSIFFNMHIFWTRGEQAFANQTANSTAVRLCGYPKPEYATFWANYQGWLGMAYFCIVPFISMVILNTLTVIRLRTRYREREGGRDRSRLTVMLLISSMFFICVTAPAFVYNNIEAMGDYSGLDEIARQRLKVADTYSTLLQYLNHSVSFYLYILTGKGFRRDVRASLRRNAGQHETQNHWESTNYSQKEQSNTISKIPAVNLQNFNDISCVTSEVTLSTETS